MRRMFRTVLSVAVAAVGAVACSEGREAPFEPQFSNGVSDKVDATARFQIVTSGTTVVQLLSGEPRNGNSGHYCDNGVYMSKVDNRQIGGNPHAQCSVQVTTPGTTVTVSFSEWANYVTPKAGNINLNFLASCTDLSCVSRYIHFQKTKNRTEGTGVIRGTGDDGSEWMIDLAQINRAGNSEIAARSIGGLTVSEVGGAGRTGTASIRW